MTEPKPEYESVTPSVPGLELQAPDIVTLSAEDVQYLRRAAITIIRLCDKAIDGRSDKTIPKRER